MESFERVELDWKGETYAVEPDRVMGLVLSIEQALTQGHQQQAMSVLFRAEGPPHGVLAAGYGAALRYAGVKVRDDEVYLYFQSGLAEGDASRIEMVQAATMGLIAIMSPPMGRVFDLAADLPGGDIKKKKNSA